MDFVGTALRLTVGRAESRRNQLYLAGFAAPPTAAWRELSGRKKKTDSPGIPEENKRSRRKQKLRGHCSLVLLS